ncbi:MAG: terminase small subunit [bacterium]
MADSILKGLLKFSEGFLPGDHLQKATDFLGQTFYEFQEGRISEGNYKEELMNWHRSQLEILQPKNPETKRSLTLRQKKFINAYRAHGNGSRAAREAGYSPRTARQAGSRNLKKPVIKAELERANDGW